MKKFLRITAFVIIFCISALILVSCGGSNKLSGKYRNTLGDVYEFTEDGKFTYGNDLLGGYIEQATGTYEIKGGKITLTPESGRLSLTADGPVTYNFSKKGDGFEMNYFTFSPVK